MEPIGYEAKNAKLLDTDSEHVRGTVRHHAYQ